ncbi:MAG: riboflavin synthase [bacterium]
MFTGIIKEIGVIEAVNRKAGSLSLRVRCPKTASGAEPGDSISVNGVCLTATTVSGSCVEMDVGEETFSRTSLAKIKVTSKVNIEPALLVGGKLGGHYVTGHIDGLGKIVSVTPASTQKTYKVRFPGELAPLIAPKGSVAVDGISLTVGDVRGDTFEVYIIPHTISETTLEGKVAGDPVNIEADVLARYVYWSQKTGGGGDKLLRKLTDYGYIGEKTDD